MAVSFRSPEGSDPPRPNFRDRLNEGSIRFIDLVFFVAFQIALGAVIGISKSEILNPLIWIVWYACSVGFILFIAHRRKVLGLWFKKEGNLKDIVWSIKVYPILFLAVMIVSLLFPLVETKDLQIDVDFMTFLILVVIGPFSEELMFRGFLYEYLRQKVKKETAIIFTSLIFALFHPISSFPVIMTLAVMLNFLYEMRDNIIVPMVLHSLNNLVVLILYGVSRR